MKTQIRLGICSVSRSVQNLRVRIKKPYSTYRDFAEFLSKISRRKLSAIFFFFFFLFFLSTKYVFSRKGCRAAKREKIFFFLGLICILTNCLVTDAKPGKMKYFWYFVKALRKDNRGVATFKDQGKMHADPVDKANIRSTSRFTQKKMTMLKSLSWKDSFIPTCQRSMSARKGF